MKTFSRTVFCFVIACVALLSSYAGAQERAHYNSAELRRESASKIAVTLYLNLPQVLHQLLAPQLTLQVFLKTRLELSDSQLEKDLDKALANLSANGYFLLPSGARVNFRKWQLPGIQDLRESFKASLLLLDMPSNLRAHLDPVKVAGEAQGKSALTQVQIQLPVALYPILVNFGNDKFWLTEQIPFAIMSF